MEIDQRSFKRFTKDILLRECPECAAFIDSSEDLRSFSWISQYYINCRSDVGWVDLCLKSRNRVLLFVENKVTAGFTDHGASLDKTERNQLEFYDSYLSEKCPDASLVLLTHLTEPPEGFKRTQHHSADSSPGASMYTVPSRGVCWWSDVQKWLSNWCRQSVPSHVPQEFLYFLTREFSEFLENQGMNLRPLEDNDFQVLFSALSRDTVRKLNRLFESLNASFQDALGKDFCTPYRAPFEAPWGQAGVVATYAYYVNQHSESWYVGWGFVGAPRFKGFSLSEDKSDGSLDSLMAFVLVDSDKVRDPVPLAEDVICDAQAKGWDVHDNRRALLKKVKVNHSKLESWFKAAVPEGIDFIRRAQAIWQASASGQGRE